MKKELKELSFKEIDYTKYSSQILEIQNLVKNLKKDKKLMKKLKTYQNKQKLIFTDIKYNFDIFMLKNISSSYKKMDKYKDKKTILKTKNNFDKPQFDCDSISSFSAC